MQHKLQSLALFVLACGGLSAAHGAEPIAVEDLARQPAIQSISMSPDGEYIVALIPSPSDPDETALVTWQTDSLEEGPKVVTPSGDRMKFIAASALKADKILVVGRQEWTGQLGGCGEGSASGATKTFISKVYLTDSSQGEFDEAFEAGNRKLGISKDTQRCLELAGTANLVDMLPLDPERVIIQQLNNASLVANYYLYNLKTKQTELLFRGGSRSTPALFHPRTSKILATSKLEPVSGGYEQQILILNPDNNDFEIHQPLTTKLNNRHSVEIAGMDEASGKFYVLTDLFSNQVQAHLYDPVARKFDPEPVIANQSYSIAGLIFGNQPSNFNKVLGFTLDGPSRQTIYVDPQLKSAQEQLQKLYPQAQVNIIRYTDTFDKVLFSAQSSELPPTYHLLVDGKQVKKLGSQRPWIDEGKLGEERWITYTSRDGREIHGILSLPANWKAGGPPIAAVIHPHGGPWSRDHTGWDVSGWIPLLTSRGYAVLRPQYRGSTGLGRDLWLAGDNQWGLKMSDDNDDAAAWLVSEGIADKTRIAIFGYSYGGFAAAAATVRPNSPYQCAIAGAPVANLARLNTTWSDNRVQRILQGQTVTGMDPMAAANNAALPVLLFVGDRDVRTPAFHAEDFYNAVKSKVPAKFMLIPDMPHSLPWYPSQQRKTLTLISDFLQNDCGMGGL